MIEEDTERAKGKKVFHVKQENEIISERGLNWRRIISVHEGARTLAAGLEYSLTNFFILRKIGVFKNIIVFKTECVVALFGYGEECCAAMLPRTTFEGLTVAAPQLFEED